MNKLTILDKIVAWKKKEIEQRKILLPLSILQTKPFPEIRDFKSALQNNAISIITEIKRMSPSAGLIREDFDPVKIAHIYEQNGAAAISVLTDEKFFGGDDRFLKEVKKSVRPPVLRKEFIIDEYQIFESRILGADAILLIVRILEDNQLQKFIETANDLKMKCLIEIHSEEELKRILTIPVDIIGINNRNLETFVTTVETSLELKEKIPKEIVTVSESGIKTRDDISKLQEKGFDAVLIGESLMREKNIAEALKKLKNTD
jgi:indole-3-glycerol phosphate synthase